MDDDPVRLYLQGILEETFNIPVFFSPPGDYILPKPCIVYTASRRKPVYASNAPYVISQSFQVIFMSYTPGFGELNAMFSMPNIIATHDTTYITNDLVHDVFTASINKI